MVWEFVGRISQHFLTFDFSYLLFMFNDLSLISGNMYIPCQTFVDTFFVLRFKIVQFLLTIFDEVQLYFHLVSTGFELSVNLLAKRKDIDKVAKEWLKFTKVLSQSLRDWMLRDLVEQFENVGHPIFFVYGNREKITSKQICF